MGVADASVTVDVMLRALLSMGATLIDIARMIKKTGRIEQTPAMFSRACNVGAPSA